MQPNEEEQAKSPWPSIVDMAMGDVPIDESCAGYPRKLAEELLRHLREDDWLLPELLPTGQIKRVPEFPGHVDGEVIVSDGQPGLGMYLVDPSDDPMDFCVNASTLSQFSRTVCEEFFPVSADHRLLWTCTIDVHPEDEPHFTMVSVSVIVVKRAVATTTVNA